MGLSPFCFTALDDFLTYEAIWGSTHTEHACVSPSSVAVCLPFIILTSWLWCPECWREFALLSSLSLKWNLKFEVILSKNHQSDAEGALNLLFKSSGCCLAGRDAEEMRASPAITADSQRQWVCIQQKEELSSIAPRRKGKEKRKREQEAGMKL